MSLSSDDGDGTGEEADPGALADAGPASLCRLITALVRSERFNEGSLEGAHESGLLARLLDRVADVVARRAGQDPESGPP